MAKPIFMDLRQHLLARCVAAAATVAAYFKPTSSAEAYSCNTIATALSECGQPIHVDYLKIVFGHVTLRTTLLRLIINRGGEAELNIWKTAADVLQKDNVYGVSITSGRRIKYITPPREGGSLQS
jgi:hypothetical protein